VELRFNSWKTRSTHESLTKLGMVLHNLPMSRVEWLSITFPKDSPSQDELYHLLQPDSYVSNSMVAWGLRLRTTQRRGQCPTHPFPPRDVLLTSPDGAYLSFLISLNSISISLVRTSNFVLSNSASSTDPCSSPRYLQPHGLPTPSVQSCSRTVA